MASGTTNVLVYLPDADDEPRAGSFPRDSSAAFRRLPLTDAEFEAVTNNVPPQMR
jgi:hypothetical protein